MNLDKSGYIPGRFYDAARPMFMFARLFGVMPVAGLTSKNPKDLMFSWISLRTIHTGILIIGFMFFNVLSFYRTITNTNTNITKMTPIVFYSSNLYAMICFVSIARKFPFVMQQWCHVESTLPRVKLQKHQYIMTYKIRIAAVVFLITSIAEHLLAVTKAFYFAHSCSKLSDPTEAYYRKAANHVFSVFEFSIIRGVFTSLLMILSTFMWNYMDVFIMVVSFGLFNLFKQMNWILMDVKRQNMPLEFWIKSRSHYRNIIKLCELVDDTICNVTLVSFSNNFYYICVCLLEVFDPAPTWLHSFSFWFSFFYLIIKSYIVSVYCSKVHEESLYPLEILRCVPRSSWHSELYLFMNEIKRANVGLSGMKLFYITKGLILTLGGTIFTYDLVLIHFRHYDAADNDPCSF